MPPGTTAFASARGTCASRSNGNSGVWPPVASGFLSRLRWRGTAREHVLPLQRQLEGVGNAGHVVTAARPPDDVQGPIAAEVPHEVLEVGVGERPRSSGLLPRELEGGPL